MVYVYDSELYHHGIKGQRWGVRRFQNPDGTLTPEGIKRYQNPKNLKKDIQKSIKQKGSVYKIENAAVDNEFNNTVKPSVLNYVQKKRKYLRYRIV